MLQSLFKDFLKLASVAAFLWAGFYFFSKYTGDPAAKKDSTIISIENETKIGKLLVDNLLLKDKSVKTVSTPTVDSAITAISKKLIMAIGETPYRYNIQVIDNPQINAFTLPGGNIFIYSGLLKESESAEEVAAVLAHELGHAEKRHVVSRMVKELGITLVFSVLTGGDAVLLSELSKTAASTVFDRDQEKEADDFAYQLMEKAHINPRVMASFFRKVEAQSGEMGRYTEFISTHPSNESRIKAALSYPLKKNFKAKPIAIDWSRVRAELNKME